MSNYSVSLVGPAPWGFRLQGGKDFNMPLSISRLNDGGKAARANVGIGDVVLTIDGISTDGMTHLEAQNKIKACTGNLNMTLQRVASATKPDIIHVPKPATHNAAPGGHVGDSTQELAEGLRRGFRENQGDNKQQNGPPRKHIVDTYTEFYHTPTHSDASKKRLIEDTEDWHPRTGTTQSRSFRILAQITGTDHMKEPEHEGAKKSNDSMEPTPPAAYTPTSVRNVSASHESPDPRPIPTNNATSPSAPKPAGPSSAAKYSGWQPPSQAAPASGWTSNSNKTSGTTAPSQKLAAASQLTEQDTLVQRAEHIPAGKRTPMCAQCNQVIRGPFLVALGKSWHPEEFNCAHCKTSMAYIGFVEEKGALYCEVCYEKFFAPECSKCQRKILGGVINALKQTWHDTCFVCSVCNDSLEGQTFFSKKDKPLCKKHAHSINI